ncbi:MAG: type II secretion system protein [Kiritimatiellae bacterium]|nr:type II secretion system protein [Kiritimatiellia bacterium]
MVPFHGKSRAAFTLVELLAVLAIVALVALLVVRRYAGVQDAARLAAARHDLATLRDAFQAYLADMEHVPGFTPVNPYVGWDACEVLNLRVHNLLSPTNVQPAESSVARRWAAAGADLPARFVRYDPDAGCGWNGPYLSPARLAPWPADDSRRWPADATFAERRFAYTGRLCHTNDTGDIVEETIVAAFGTTNELALLDPWQNPYVVQFPAATPSNFDDLPPARGGVHRSFAITRRLPYARIVSAGPDGILQTPFDLAAGATASGTTARGDDLVLFLFAPPALEVP